MAIPRRFPIPFELAFSSGAFQVSEVTGVTDFEKSTRENKVQQVDQETGKLLWQVDVVDADPEAKRSSKTVSVKIAANVQPVPPSNDGASPFTPVEFIGLTALPWIESSETFSKISWSFRADDIVAPSRGRVARDSDRSRPARASGTPVSSADSPSAA